MFQCIKLLSDKLSYILYKICISIGSTEGTVFTVSKQHQICHFLHNITNKVIGPAWELALFSRVGEVSICRTKWAVKQRTTLELCARAHLTWMSNLRAAFICMRFTEAESELSPVLLRAKHSAAVSHTLSPSHFLQQNKLQSMPAAQCLVQV